MYTSKIISFLKSLRIVHNGTSVVPLLTSDIQLLIVDMSYHIVGSWDIFFIFLVEALNLNINKLQKAVPGILKSHFLDRV